MILVIVYSARVRTEAVGRLAWYIANETNSVNKQPQFSELDVSRLCDLFLVDTPRALVEEKTSPSVFQVHELSYIKKFDFFVITEFT